MSAKTINYLRGKLWYRLLKVIYIFSFIYCIGLSIVFAIEEFDGGYILLSIFAFILFPSLIYVGFEIIRRVFYYVAIGTIQPVDDNYFIKLKKYKFIIIDVAIIFIIIFAYGVWDANKIDQQRINMRKECSSRAIENINQQNEDKNYGNYIPVAERASYNHKDFKLYFERCLREKGITN